MTETTTQPDPQVEPDSDPRRDALRCSECQFRADDSPSGWFHATNHRYATGHNVEPLATPPPVNATESDLASQLAVNAAAYLEGTNLWDDRGRRWQVDRYDRITRPDEVTLTRYGQDGTGVVPSSSASRRGPSPSPPSTPPRRARER